MSPGIRTLVACGLLSTALGSIHAYSLFIDPFESELGSSRSAVSAVYSVALAALTVSVLFAHPLFRRFSGQTVTIGTGLGAAVGLLIAAEAGALPLVALGYGVLFGAANGVGYSFGLQVAAEANPDRRGFVMAVVTAVYAFGAAGGALLLSATIDAAGAAGALRWLAATILGVAIAAALLLPRTGSVSPGPVGGRPTSIDRVRIIRTWAAYGLAVLAGLMAIGHAAAIVKEAGGSEQLSVVTVVIAGMANAVGGLAIAAVADRTDSRSWLIGLPLASAFGLVVLAIASSASLALGALALVAAVYGAVIAIYPSAVSRTFGEQNYPVAYGRIFTAWGLGGVVGPIGAGAIFDVAGSYSLPLSLAAIAALGSAFLARSSVDDHPTATTHSALGPVNPVSAQTRSRLVEWSCRSRKPRSP